MQISLLIQSKKSGMNDLWLGVIDGTPLTKLTKLTATLHPYGLVACCELVRANMPSQFIDSPSASSLVQSLRESLLRQSSAGSLQSAARLLSELTPSLPHVLDPLLLCMHSRDGELERQSTLDEVWRVVALVGHGWRWRYFCRGAPRENEILVKAHAGLSDPTAHGPLHQYLCSELSRGGGGIEQVACWGHYSLVATLLDSIAGGCGWDALGALLPSTAAMLDAAPCDPSLFARSLQLVASILQRTPPPSIAQLAWRLVRSALRHGTEEAHVGLLCECLRLGRVPCVDQLHCARAALHFLDISGRGTAAHVSSTAAALSQALRSSDSIVCDLARIQMSEQPMSNILRDLPAAALGSARTIQRVEENDSSALVSLVGEAPAVRKPVMIGPKSLEDDFDLTGTIQASLGHTSSGLADLFFTDTCSLDCTKANGGDTDWHSVLLTKLSVFPICIKSHHPTTVVFVRSPRAQQLG